MNVRGKSRKNKINKEVFREDRYSDMLGNLNRGRENCGWGGRIGSQAESVKGSNLGETYSAWGQACGDSQAQMEQLDQNSEAMFLFGMTKA